MSGLIPVESVQATLIIGRGIKASAIVEGNYLVLHGGTIESFGKPERIAIVISAGRRCVRESEVIAALQRMDAFTDLS